MAVGKFGTDLDAIAYASIVPADDLITVCDINGDNAGTGPEDKKIAAVEFIKRSLGSADVSWMTTLAMSSVVQADDKFLIWDASATAIKVITGSDLLQYTYFGTSISSITALASFGSIDTAADYFLVWDNSATAWKKLLASDLTNKLMPTGATNYTATPQTVTSASSHSRLTNRGATQIIEFDLPAATVGYKFTFNRVANYAVRLDPNGSETIGDGAAGKYLELTVRGQVNIECLATGEWEVIGGSSIYTFEA